MSVTPRGVAAAILVAVVAAVCVRLGFWQLDRREQRQERNEALRAALAQPPLILDSASVARLARSPEAYLNRRVRVRGSYDPTREVVLRGRTHEGRPGVHLVTPLEIAGAGADVLVNRGWVPSPDAATVDPRPLREAGIQTVEGILQQIPAAGDAGTPVPVGTGDARLTSYRRLDLPTLRARFARPLLPLYVQQLPDPAHTGQPVRVPLPALDEGPHLGYAVQWFSFAVIAVGGFLLLLVWRR